MLKPTRIQKTWYNIQTKHTIEFSNNKPHTNPPHTKNEEKPVPVAPPRKTIAATSPTYQNQTQPANRTRTPYPAHQTTTHSRTQHTRQKNEEKPSRTVTHQDQNRKNLSEQAPEPRGDNKRLYTPPPPNTNPHPSETQHKPHNPTTTRKNSPE